jgi:D-tyrosyl-tRNA(Tyr) deacylase
LQEHFPHFSPTGGVLKSRTRTRSMCTIILREASTKIACTAYSENRSKNAWANTMIGLLQRVTRAEVAVDDQKIAEIGRGLLVLVAVHRDDSERDIARLAERILGYRVFPDTTGRMNRSLEDIGGDLLLVPQFTLAADTKKGTRASFTRAAPPEKATAYFEQLCDLCKERLERVETGEFGANMQVSLVNNGPVTFWLES